MQLNIRIDTNIILSGDIKIDNQSVATLNAVVTKDNIRTTQITKNNTLYADNIDTVLKGVADFNAEIKRIELLVKSLEFNQAINQAVGGDVDDV